MDLSKIKKISPLYSYWISNQTDEDEKERLRIANVDSKASYLFEEEPYKWENLFQSIARQIAYGDSDSIRGMKVLLSTILIPYREEVLEHFAKEGIFEEAIIEELSKVDSLGAPTKSNVFRFLKILFIIFSNPYGIAIRRKKLHSYEFTGFFIHSFRQKLSALLRPFRPI